MYSDHLYYVSYSNDNHSNWIKNVYYIHNICLIRLLI